MPWFQTLSSRGSTPSAQSQAHPQAIYDAHRHRRCSKSRRWRGGQAQSGRASVVPGPDHLPSPLSTVPSTFWPGLGQLGPARKDLLGSPRDRSPMSVCL